MTQPSPADGHPNPDERDEERAGPTVRDRRRIDPETFELRDPQDTAAAEEVSGEADASDDTSAEAEADPRQAEIDDLTRQVAERTNDLQRLQAEYVNYKRRVDRDREAARGITISTVMSELLPILDNITAARDHGELTGGFKAVAEDVEKLAAKHEVAAFGEVGDAFDPHQHEALMQVSDPGDAHPVCVQIFQVGYRQGDKVLRPARVATGAPVDQAQTDDDSADSAD